MVEERPGALEFPGDGLGDFVGAEDRGDDGQVITGPGTSMAAGVPQKCVHGESLEIILPKRSQRLQRPQRFKKRNKKPGP
jgi:hypothetical protein